jgi:hypothetical protein
MVVRKFSGENHAPTCVKSLTNFIPMRSNWTSCFFCLFPINQNKNTQTFRGPCNKHSYQVGHQLVMWFQWKLKIDRGDFFYCQCITHLKITRDDRITKLVSIRYYFYFSSISHLIACTILVNIPFAMICHIIYPLSTLHPIIMWFQWKLKIDRGRRGWGRMVVGFTTACAISVYHHCIQRWQMGCCLFWIFLSEITVPIGTKLGRNVHYIVLKTVNFFVAIGGTQTKTKKKPKCVKLAQWFQRGRFKRDNNPFVIFVYFLSTKIT